MSRSISTHVATPPESYWVGGEITVLASRGSYTVLVTTLARANRAARVGRLRDPPS